MIRPKEPVIIRCCQFETSKNELKPLFTHSYIENGEIWVAGEHIDQQVSFCPMCGRKADKQVDRKEIGQ